MKYSTYAWTLPLSGILHIVCIVALLMTVELPESITVEANLDVAQESHPVQAQLIDTDLVQQAILRQKKQQQYQQQQREQTKQEALRVKQQALKAQQAQVHAQAEQKKLAQLQEQHQQQQRQLQQAQHKLVQAQKKLEQEQKALKRQRQKTEQQAAALAVQQKKAQQRAVDREIKSYVAGIVAQIEQNRQKLPLLPTHLIANVTFKVRPDGTVYAVKLTKKSGYPAYDEQALRAVFKASPFKMPHNPEVLKVFMKRYQDGFTSGLKNEHEALT